MTKKQFRARLRLLIILLLLLLGMIGFVVGKYITTVPLEGNVTFTAKLAESVILREHQAARQSDGSYELVEPYVNQNTYYLLPGLDIPKDPHIVITGKTPIPAYLFVEVKNEIGNASIGYALADCWTTTALKTPQNGGIVYVYCDAEKNPVKITSDLTVNILKNDQVTVNQGLLSGDASNLLTFYAYLVEAVN